MDDPCPPSWLFIPDCFVCSPTARSLFWGIPHPPHACIAPVYVRSAPSHCLDSWPVVSRHIKPTGNPSQTSLSFFNHLCFSYSLYFLYFFYQCPLKLLPKCTPRPPPASSLFSLPLSLALMPSTLTNLNMTLPLLVPALKALLLASADLLS